MLLVVHTVYESRVFCKFVEKLREESSVYGAYSISFEDAFTLYTVAYMTALRFNGERVVLVDAGAGIGFSTIWIAKALVDSGVLGEVIAIERDWRRGRRLKEVLNSLGVRYRVEIDDALNVAKNIPRIHLVFIDIDKEQYYDFYKLIEERVVIGGAIVVHNVFMYHSSIRSLVEALSKYPWKSTIVPTRMPGGGMLISIKTQ